MPAAPLSATGVFDESLEPTQIVMQPVLDKVCTTSGVGRLSDRAVGRRGSTRHRPKHHACGRPFGD
jgi:hypothetical protein